MARFRQMSPFLLLAVVPLVAAAPSSLTSMKWQRRVLLVSAPSADDAALRDQRRIIDGWKAAGDARDLSVVELVGDQVSGVTDTAAMLRNRYALPASGFTVILIGKDGGEKARSGSPLTAAVLEATIDAMPMRRAGDR